MASPSVKQVHTFDKIICTTYISCELDFDDLRWLVHNVSLVGEFLIKMEVFKAF